MRVLLTLHHALDPNQGAAGATIELGAALERMGCEVSFYSFDDAFRRGGVNDARRGIAFPWRLANFLARHGRAYDVVDSSTGDAWVWASARRQRHSPAPGLVVRSHGLEHTLDRRVRRPAGRGGESTRRRYAVYHGGLRLWEVERTLRLADACFFLNQVDARLARRFLGVDGGKSHVAVNGLPARFFGVPAPARPADGVLRLGWIGTWIPRKGTAALVDAVDRLASAEGPVQPFELTLLGTRVSEREILPAFSPVARQHIRVVPEYANRDLPALLAGLGVLLLPSLAEGFSVALGEAMACGLAPIASRVGGAAGLIGTDERCGLLVRPHDAIALEAAIRRLGSDPDRLFAMRCAAQDRAAGLRWEASAAAARDVYLALRPGSG